MRSLSSVPRSRVSRRRSSSSGLGGRTLEQTRRSPRAQPISVGASFSPWIASFLARRGRRSTAIEAGSTTWLSIPLASSRRCSQKPSRPASWMTTTRTATPARRSAVAPSRASRSSSAPPSPPLTACLDSFSLPGALTVTSQRDLLSSSDAKSLASSARPGAWGVVAGWWVGIGRLHAVLWRPRPTKPSRHPPAWDLFRRLDALGVNDRGGGAGLPAFLFAQHHHEVVADRLPDARAREVAHVAVDRPPGREGRGRRQVAPLAAGAHQVEQTVQHPPHVGGARPTARLGGRDHRREQGVLLVAQGLPGAEVADQRPALRCPHGVPPRRAAPFLDRRHGLSASRSPGRRALLKRPLSLSYGLGGLVALD